MHSIHTGRIPAADQLCALYDAVGWTAYSNDPDRTRHAIANSSSVVTAWDGRELIERALTRPTGVFRHVGTRELTALRAFARFSTAT